MLTMSGAVTEAILVLSSAVSAKTPPLVKKLEFAQEVVSETKMLSCYPVINMSWKHTDNKDMMDV